MGKLKERCLLRCKFTKFKSSDSSTQIFVALNEFMVILFTRLGTHLVDGRLISALWTDQGEIFYKQFVKDKEDVPKIYKMYFLVDFTF